MEERLLNVFNKVFGLMLNGLDDNLKQGDLDGWDSLGHMNLISAIEEEFKIALQTEDVIAMENIGAIKMVLNKKGF